MSKKIFKGGFTIGFFDPKCKKCGKKFTKLDLKEGYCINCTTVHPSANEIGINLNTMLTEVLGKPLEQMTDKDFAKRIKKFDQSNAKKSVKTAVNCLNDETELLVNGETFTCKIDSISPNKQFYLLYGRIYGKNKQCLVVLHQGKIIFSHTISGEIERSSIIDSRAFCICETGFDDAARHMTNDLLYFDSNFQKKLLYSFDYVSNSLEFLDNGNVICIKALGEIRFYNTSTGELLPESTLNSDEEEGNNLFENPLSKLGKSILDIDLHEVDCNGYHLYHKVYSEVNTTQCNLSEEQIYLYIDKLKICFDTHLTDYTCALAYKLLGELYIRIADKENTLAAYKNALERNPKIGLKRKIASLEKELN